MKPIIVMIMVAVIVSLGSALFSMTRGAGSAQRMANALTLRVALSVTLILVLLISWKMGLMEPPGSAG